MKRIEDRINEVTLYLDELTEIMPTDFDSYESSKIVKAASERYVERIVEGVIDLSFLIIKLKKYDLPDDDIDSLRILEKKKVISAKTCERMRLAKGMRNIIAHEYGRVDDHIIYESITTELKNDVNRFIREIKNFLEFTYIK